MKDLLPSLFLISFLLFACQSTPDKDANTSTNEESTPTEETQSSTSSSYLVLVSKENAEGNEEYGYAKPTGEVVIPMGKYIMAFTDTLRSFAVVITQDGKMIGINANDQELYEVYRYDNGPDYLSDGLFRIVINGKIGYANEQGKIAIAPQFTCTNPFENGKAKVAVNCELVKDGEYTRMESEEWYYINTKGEKVEG